MLLADFARHFAREELGWSQAEVEDVCVTGDPDDFRAMVLLSVQMRRTSQSKLKIALRIVGSGSNYVVTDDSMDEDDFATFKANAKEGK